MGNYPRLVYHRCPRCGGGVPNDLTPGAYPGAISRLDNKTEICSECGMMEAIEQEFSGSPLPKSKWWSHDE